MPTPFLLQGHRGARGLKPENTLPSFEFALDCGVTSIETDVHLTRDHVPVLCHDPMLSARLCRGTPPSSPICQQSLAELRAFVVDVNPTPDRFPDQDALATPVAHLVAHARGMEPFAIPTLADLFTLVAVYVGPAGAKAGKTEEQRHRARTLNFDLELKRVPFRPDYINDAFDGTRPALLEESVVQVVRQWGLVDRTTVRSFDHRSVRAIRSLEPGLTGAVLVAGTTPAAVTELVRAADAQIYCPDYEFLDAEQVRRLHEANIPVIPWTVNEAADWKRLLDWGVDGITTDFPNRLAEMLQRR